VASDAERLQVSLIKAGTTIFDGYDVVNDLGWEQASYRLTNGTQRLFT
jgi:hypothetical protein